jgi:uncharacterized protein with GYD domain
VKTFILMSRLSPQGPSLVEVASKMRDGAKTARTWIDRAKRLCPEAKFVAHYAILGSYDFMDIYQAPSEETAAKVSMICSAEGTFQVESWTAIPDRRLDELAEEVGSGFSSGEEL